MSITDNHLHMVSFSLKSLKVVFQVMWFILSNQNTRKFSNIIKYCEKSWNVKEKISIERAKLFTAALLKIQKASCPYFTEKWMNSITINVLYIYKWFEKRGNFLSNDYQITFKTKTLVVNKVMAYSHSAIHGRQWQWLHLRIGSGCMDINESFVAVTVATCKWVFEDVALQTTQHITLFSITLTLC